MEANRSDSDLALVNEINLGSRQSTRIRRQSSAFSPNIRSSRAKATKLKANFEITECRGFTYKSNTAQTKVNNKMPVASIIKFFLKKQNLNSNQIKFAYFCEESQSWKKVRPDQNIDSGRAYKIRAYQCKTNGRKMKRTPRKAETNVKDKNIEISPVQSNEVLNTFMYMSQYFNYMMMNFGISDSFGFRYHKF